MASSYVGGSVTAKVELDSSKFDSALQKLTERVKNFQAQLNSTNTDSLATKVANLENKLSATDTKVNDLTNRVKNFNTTQKELGNSVKTTASNLDMFNKKLQGSNNAGKNFDNVAKKVERVNSAVKKSANSFNVTNAQLKTAGTALNMFEQKLNGTNSALSKTNSQTKQSAAGFKAMGGSMNSASNSVKILSNNLYKIRGVLLSLKMIFTAMGGMALWGFATNIAEGVKETFKAKNEMEAQLRQNEKVGEGGIAYFNKALDDTVSKFKKINKYSIGETVSAIGLEFDLNAKQMAESLDVVSMVQSEYVRAGRKEEEAALAVKDILQGEFSRLSRETGVGKEELQSYGWDGDKTNVESLMKALRKAAKDRHWDLFAAKATSLNDVMTILKSRFSETGADIMQSATPLIVGAFNAIIGAIDKIQGAFNGLNSFWQNFTILGGGVGGIFALGTALPMLAKGFGLVDIATIGWGKSLLTTAFNLDKTEVATYGFRKALMGVISGTDAAKVSEVGLVKSMAARILGVKQSTLAENGLLTAMVQSKAVMKGTNETLAKLAGNSMGTAQKLAYLTTNMDLTTAKSLGTGKALLKVATSTKILKMAILGLTAISLVSWLAGIAAWCDTVKKNVDAFNDVSENGKSILKDATDSVNSYEKALGDLKEGTDAYIRTKANYDQALANQKDIKQAISLTKEYKKQNKQAEKDIKLSHQRDLKNSYLLAGKDYKEATELASNYTEKVKSGQESIARSLDVYKDRLYKSSQHVNEHVAQLKEAGAAEDEMIKYIDEYNLEAENAAELWKKFNQGDMASGAYAILSELKLAWIDIAHHPEVVTLFQKLNEYAEWLKPALHTITEDLKWLALRGADALNWLLSSDWGKTALSITGVGIGLAAIGKKIYNVLGGTKSTIDILKTLGGKLKDRIKDWRKLGKEAEDANTKMGGGKGKDSTSTGGINGDTPDKAKVPFRETLKQDAQNYARAAIGIAAGMLLITEAVYMLKAPMWALAEVGKDFKAQEPHIQAGIEGLQLISPILAALLPPVIALTLIMDHYAPSFSQMVKGGLKAALGIALGIGLVSEAILLLVAPITALAGLGAVYGAFQTNVQQGIAAIKATNDALYALIPWVPVFAAGIALAAITIGTEGIGGIAIVAAAAGIALGIGLVTEAILMLNLPLGAIASIGSQYTDLEGVKRGAEALKVTAEALGYVEQGMHSLTLVRWELLADYVAQLIGKTLNIDLGSLTGEGGVFKQLEKFAQDFAQVNITPIDTAKAETLKTVAANIDTVSEALKTVKDAAAKLPKFGQDVSNNFGNGLGDTALQGVEGETTDTASFFEQIKKPIEDLNTFVTEFNNMPVTPPDTAKVDAINQASSMITQVKSAVDNLNAVLGGAVDAGWNANMASGGIGAAVSGFVFGLGGGTGEYSSSLGTSLTQMYNAIKDIMTFTQKVNSLTGGGEGGNASVTSAVDMVTAVDNAIQNLQNTLSIAAPNVKESAKAIGTGIKDGVKEGMNGMSEGVIQQVTTALNAAKPYASTYGKGVGGAGKSGFQSEFKIKEAVSTELGYALSEMENKKQEFYDKGYALGKSSADGFKAGADTHSPGIIARTMFAELGYVSDALDGAIATMPNQTYSLAQTMASNFNPSLDIGGISVDELSQFQTGLDTVTSMATNTDLQTSAAFMNMNMNVTSSMNGMTTTVNGAFNGIQQNTTTRYGQLVNTTRVSLNSMQSQTTRNINAIKTSWRSMQNALIASAENIRNETSSKIHTLESNMASFWNKVQNPALLLASGSPTANSTKPMFRKKMAGSPSSKGTIPRRRKAAGTSVPKPKTTNNAKLTSREFSFRNAISEYLFCLLNGGVCAAGGWNFNWSPDIKQALLKWHTHFGDIYDDVLTVGKFENDDFPVRGNATIAKRYIGEKIASTDYEFYWNDKYDPITAWNRGSFNCVDGARLAIALADKFGFGGGSVAYGSWAGTGHGFAVIPGLGVIDATALQRGYGFTSPKVSGYPSAGSRGTISRNRPTTPKGGMGDTHNYGDVNLTINVYGNDVEVNDTTVEKSTAKQIIDLLGINPSTGQ